MSVLQSLLFAALGTSYIWGAGSLKEAPKAGPNGFETKHGRGFDCSGFAQWALYILGIVPATMWGDMNAADLANACEPVKLKPSLTSGDLVFYGGHHISHVMVYCGNGMVIGATGGGSQTFGNDPNACVQCRPIGYRGDFVVFGRIKKEFRAAQA